MRKEGRRRGGAARTLALAAVASLALTGCQDILNSLLDNAAPTGLDASDGDYANSISVSWSAPSLSSDKWKDYSVAYYLLSYSSSGANDYNIHCASTSYSISVSDSNRATSYSITVEAILKTPSGGTETGGSASDTGFAMDASPLLWYDGGASYPAGSGDTWYETMLQKGFTYRFDFGTNGSVEFYPYKTLDSVGGTGSGSSVSWTCDSDGSGHKFYVRVHKDASGSFSASCDFGY